jgi:hypothetical protein
MEEHNKVASSLHELATVAEDAVAAVEALTTAAQTLATATADIETVVSFTDTSAEPGSATADTFTGLSAFDATDAAVTITAEKCTAESVVLVQLETVDDTLTRVVVAVSAGEFTVTGNAAATGVTNFRWAIISHPEMADGSFSDTSGTPGNAEANTYLGASAIALGATAATITSDKCTAESVVIVQLETVDATLTRVVVAVGTGEDAGTFTVTGNAAADDDVVFRWAIVSQADLAGLLSVWSGMSSAAAGLAEAVEGLAEAVTAEQVHLARFQERDGERELLTLEKHPNTGPAAPPLPKKE